MGGRGNPFEGEVEDLALGKGEEEEEEEVDYEGKEKEEKVTKKVKLVELVAHQCLDEDKGDLMII